MLKKKEKLIYTSSPDHMFYPTVAEWFETDLVHYGHMGSNPTWTTSMKVSVCLRRVSWFDTNERKNLEGP